MTESVTRTCHSCKITKAIELFYHDACAPLGRSYQCAECAKARSKQYAASHPEKTRAQAKRHRIRWPQRVAAQKARWYAENVERSKARAKKHTQKKRAEDPQWFHDTYLKWKFGLPRGSYVRMLAEQGGKCAICGATQPGRKQRTFHLDHCHDSGKIRGLLCGSCNVGIAHLKHSETVLLSAIEYLRK